MISFARQLMVLVPVLIMAVGGLVLGPGFVFAQQAQAQAQNQSTEQMIRETQQSAHQYLTENEKQVNDIQFETRWGAVHSVPPGTLAALFADCAPGEYAVAEQHMFETREITAPLSFSIASPDNTMSWLMVVYNADDDPLDASVAAVCASEAGSDSSVDLDYNTRSTIQNIVNQVIVKSGTINFGQITNIYQNITQIANQYVNITGNNNTVTQIINQSASQIVASNGSNINQTIAQNAQQIAGISVNATDGAATAPLGPGQAVGVNATGTEQEEEGIQPEEQIPGGGNATRTPSSGTGDEDTTTGLVPPIDNDPLAGSSSQQIQPQPPQQGIDEEPVAEEEEETAGTTEPEEDTTTTPDDEGAAGDEDEELTTTEEDGGDGDGDGGDEEGEGIEE